MMAGKEEINVSIREMDCRACAHKGLNDTYMCHVDNDADFPTLWQFREDLITLLRKYELPAPLALDYLESFRNDILYHYNTKDLRNGLGLIFYGCKKKWAGTEKQSSCPSAEEFTKEQSI